MNPSASPSTDRFAAALDTFHDRGPGRTCGLFDFGSARHLRARFELTFERLGPLSGRRGLDIGCGTGIYLVEALRRGAAHVVGVDPAPGMLEWARRRGEQSGWLDKITLLEGYFPQMSPAGPFDFAIVVGILDYVSDPLEFLRAVRGLVTGKTVATFPSQDWFYAPLRKLRGRLRREPVYFYDPRRIRAICGQAGFGAVDVVQLDGGGADYHVDLTP